MKSIGIFMALVLCACSGGVGPSIGHENGAAVVVVDYRKDGGTTVDGVPVDSSMVLAEVKKKAGNGRFSMIHFISHNKADDPKEYQVTSEIQALCKDLRMEYTIKIPSGIFDDIVMVECKRGGIVMVEESPFVASAALDEIKKLVGRGSASMIEFVCRDQASSPDEDKFIARIKALCRDLHVKFSITYPARDADDLAAE